MQNYPKQILSIEQQVQSLKDAGMSVSSDEKAAKYLQKVGYYRLRGYTIRTNFKKIDKVAVLVSYVFQ